MEWSDEGAEVAGHEFTLFSQRAPAATDGSIDATTATTATAAAAAAAAATASASPPAADTSLRLLASGLRTTSYVATSLPSQTAFRFYLRRGSEQSGWSDLSPPSEATASDLGAPPAKPSGLRFSPLQPSERSVSCGNLRVEWRESEGCAISAHRVQVRKEGSSKWASEAVGGGGSATSYSGFDTDGEVAHLCRSAGGQSLEVRIQAKNQAGGSEGGWSGFSHALSIRIGATRPPTHAAPPKATAAATCYGASIRWEAADTHGAPLDMQRVQWAPTRAVTLADPAAAEAAWSVHGQSLDVPSGRQVTNLDALDGGVSYSIRVLSQSLLGWGAPSPALELLTPLGEGQVAAPMPPAYLPPPAGRCDAVLLRLPPRRRGCEKDEALILQIRASPDDWQDLQTIDQGVPSPPAAPGSALDASGEALRGVSVASSAPSANVGAAFGSSERSAEAISPGEAAGTAAAATAAPRGRRVQALAAAVGTSAAETVLITSLDAYTGYAFRLVSQRGGRLSSPSQPTSILMPGAGGNLIAEAPVVTALGSASYRVTWTRNGGAPCRPALSWDLLMMRPASPSLTALPLPASITGDVQLGSRSFTPAAADVQILASALSNASAFEALSVRCPPPGCSFRLHAINLHGFDGQAWTATSPLVPTNVLLPLPPGAQRFEARLSAEVGGGGGGGGGAGGGSGGGAGGGDGTWAGDAAGFATAIGSQWSCTRADQLCSPEKLAVREVYGHARFIVFDLLPAMAPVSIPTSYTPTFGPPASQPTSPVATPVASGGAVGKPAVDALLAAARSVGHITELLALPQPMAGGGEAQQQPVTLYRSGGGVSSGGGAVLMAIKGMAATCALALLLLTCRTAMRQYAQRNRSHTHGARARDGGSSGRHRRQRLREMENDFLDEMAMGADGEDGMEDGMEDVFDGSGTVRRVKRASNGVTPATRVPPAPPPAPPPPPPPQHIRCVEPPHPSSHASARCPPPAQPHACPHPPPSAPARAAMSRPRGAEMKVMVTLEGDEEIELAIPMGGVTSTEELLRNAFDACAVRTLYSLSGFPT